MAVLSCRRRGSWVTNLLTLIVLCATTCHDAFRFFHQPYSRSNSNSNVNSRTELRMVFDFLRQRSQEGIAQVQNIATKTLEGKLGEAFDDTRNYVRTRNRIDAENLRRLTAGLARSRDRLLSGISGAFADDGDGIEARLTKLEEVLMQADIGAATATTIIEDLRTYARSERLTEDDILPVLRARLIEALTPTTPDGTNGINFAPAGSGEPTVIFVIGANGMGKTTTIGKVASRLRNEGNLTVLLGACDTFRAAAVEQLGEWAVRANVSIERPTEAERGGDPVPVVARSVRRAREEKFDVLIVDTSGRLSNNFELTAQLQDMKAAIVKELPSAPHETLLVVDGSLGRNAVDQAAAWRKYVGVSGLAITKLDGTARGGFVVSVVRDLGLPVKFIGVGEKIDDLRDFKAEDFVDALLGNDEATSAMMQARVDKMFNIVGAAAPGAGGATASASASMAAAASAAASDPSARLRASFGGNDADDDDDDDDDDDGKPDTAGKPKRAKRPKPQSSKKKAKKAAK